MATIAHDVGPRFRGADDRFFFVSAFVIAVIVIAGFSLQFAMGRSTFNAPPLVHAHAIAFMGWVAIYIAQTMSAVTGARRLHRRLGWIAAFWVAAMVVLGIVATVAMARRGATPFFFRPAYFVVMNSLSIIVFAGLTAAAIVRRRQTMWHRRLHFCGMAVLTGPAFGRLLPMPLLIPHAGLAVTAAVLLLPLAGVIADRRRLGRVHPAWAWGIGAIVAMQLAIEVVGGGPAGAAIYEAATTGTPGAARAPLDFPPPPPPP